MANWVSTGISIVAPLRFPCSARRTSSEDEPDEGSTREKLERAFLFLADLGIRSPALSRLAFTESLRYMGAHPIDERLTDEEPVRQFQSITRTMLRQGQERGEVRLEVEPEHGAALIESAFFRTLARWLRDGGPVRDVHIEIRGKLDIIFEGLGRR